MNTRVASIATFLAAGIFLLFGGIYMVKSSFMPYHSETIGQNWEELDSNMQFMILGLMRAVSGGFIAVAIMISWLQIIFNKTYHRWIPVIIFWGGAIVSGASIYATLIVRMNTDGNPPTALAITGIGLLFIGYAFNKRAIADFKKNKG